MRQRLAQCKLKQVLIFFIPGLLKLHLNRILMGALFLGEWRGGGGICAFSNHITLQHMAIEGRSTEKTAAVTFSRNLNCLSLLKLQRAWV